MTNQNTLASRWAEVVGLAWADEDFRRRLLADPKREIAALGIEVEGGANIRVLEETPGETLLVVPQMPVHIREMAKKPEPHSKSCLPDDCTNCEKSCSSCSDAKKKHKPCKEEPEKPKKPAKKKLPAKKPPAKKVPAKPKKPVKRKK